MNYNSIFSENLPLFIPLISFEVGLALITLIHIFRHKHYRMGNRILWIILVLLIQPFGAIAYLILGRGDD